ncbi:hypothetical protein ACSSV1_005986 [Labrenzia sp. MBR-25]
MAMNISTNFAKCVGTKILCYLHWALRASSIA